MKYTQTFFCLCAFFLLIFGCTTPKYVVQGLDLNQDIVFGGDVTIDGNLFANNIYGEDWNKLDNGFETIDLVTPDVYVPVKKLKAGSLNGFSVLDGNLIPEYPGMYLVNISTSVYAANVGGAYGMKLFINEVGQNNCYSHSEITTTSNSMGITCLIRLNLRDKVNVRFDDHSNPVRDIIIESFNLNLVRVGN